jgi:hypothetical protein
MAASLSSSSHPRREEDAGGAAVCCMCGDHGLPQELFRCKSCRARLQHSYCSNLYPRDTAYRSCNWCLVRLPPAPGAGAAGHAAASSTKRKAATTASDEERHHREGRSSSSPRRVPSELGCPVKKRVKVQRYKLLAEVIRC